MCVCVYECVCVFMNVCVCACVFMNVYVCMYGKVALLNPFFRGVGGMLTDVVYF